MIRHAFFAICCVVLDSNRVGVSGQYREHALCVVQCCAQCVQSVLHFACINYRVHQLLQSSMQTQNGAAKVFYECRCESFRQLDIRILGNVCVCSRRKHAMDATITLPVRSSSAERTRCYHRGTRNVADVAQPRPHVCECEFACMCWFAPPARLI